MNPVSSVSLALAAFAVLATVAQAQTPSFGGCNIFPFDSWWNTPIDNMPVHPKSETWKTMIGKTRGLKGDFGAGLYEGKIMGIPYTIVPQNQPLVDIFYDPYGEESDAGPFPIPPNAPVEGGGDEHVLVVQQGSCKLYELYVGAKRAGSNAWDAASGAKYDLNSNAFRPLDWTSADAAGLPIFPGLIKYDEIAAGEIRHAIRFTVPTTDKRYVWPATHWASRVDNSSYPPMGARFRLRANYSISGYSGPIQIILRALKKYGLVIADNGSPWYMSGAPDDRWDNDMLQELKNVLGSNMEAVDVSSMMVAATSGQVKTPVPTPPTVPPTQAPSPPPTFRLTKSPTPPTVLPTRAPSPPPTFRVTKSPTKFPTRRTKRPTPYPTKRPGSRKLRTEIENEA